jgi:hypothetical protein
MRDNLKAMDIIKYRTFSARARTLTLRREPSSECHIKFEHLDRLKEAAMSRKRFTQK